MGKRTDKNEKPSYHEFKYKNVALTKDIAMKNISKMIFGLTLASQVLVLPACGKKNKAAENHDTTCTPGQVYNASYGCLQASPGQAGYGLLNGQPVVATCWGGTIMTQYGCLSQGSCQLGMAQYNGTCVSANAANTNINGQVNPAQYNGQYNTNGQYNNTGYYNGQYTSGTVYTNSAPTWHWTGYTWIQY
jgi:hypothetical protein